MRVVRPDSKNCRETKKTESREGVVDGPHRQEDERQEVGLVAGAEKGSNRGLP